MTIRPLSIAAFLCISIISNAQNVGVGTSTPNSSAILDISSTSKGVLLPRMTTAQRDAIVNPASGLIIFNTDDQCTDVYNGSVWVKNCGFKSNGNVTVPAGSWIQKTDFGGTGRKNAVSFSIGNKGYIGTGNDGTLKKDFWEYSPATNAWSQIMDFPGLPREFAVGFSIGNNGYVGTGFTGATSTDDFYEYNPALNIWTIKSPLPPIGRSEALGFSIGNKGYIGGGKFTALLNDFWEYSPLTDTWTEKTSLPIFGRRGAACFSIGTKGYFATGTMGSGAFFADVYEYNQVTNSWATKANFPGGARGYAAGFSTSTNGYIGTGNSGSAIYYKDFWEYNQASDTWTQKQDYFEPVYGATGFSIGNRGYMGTGAQFSTPGKTFGQYNITDTTAASLVSNLPANTTQITDGIWTKNNYSIFGNGNVGIGTNNPNAPLQFANTSVNRKIVLYEEANNDHQFLGMGVHLGNLRYQSANINEDHVFFAGTSATTSTELFRIKGNGNIGIGISVPNAQLQLANTAVNRKIVLYDVNNNDHQFSGFGINSDAVRYQTASTTTDHAFFAGASSTTSTELFRIKGNGNIGIANSNPLAPLAFSNGLGNKIAFYANSTTSQYGIGIQSGQLQLYTDIEGTSFAFGYGSSNNFSERMRINNFGTDGMVLSGRILIKNGTGLLTDVPGVWTYKADNSALLGFMGTQNNTNMGFFSGITNQWGLVFDAANMRVGIGTSTPSQTLHVAGNILATGTITPSDVRYKKNIFLIDHPLEKLQQLNGVTYNYRQDEFPDMKFPDAKQVGLIAQEVEKVFPQLVFTDDKGYKAVDYVKLTPLLIEALKEEKAEREKLQKRIEALEKK